MKIKVVPFGRVSEAVLTNLVNNLQAKLRMPVELEEVKPIPSGSYNSARAQYLAGGFLAELRKLAQAENNTKFLGLTEVDLYSQGLNFIFGQADIGGPAAVISLARLRPASFRLTDERSLLNERVLKEAVHELGHNFGFQHCDNPKCVMHFSNSIKDTDIKSADYCDQHKVPS